MKVLYITAETPFGKRETFILEEMLQIRHKVDLLVSPRNPGKYIYNENAKQLLNETLNVPFFSVAVFSNLIPNIISFRFWIILFELISFSNSTKNLLKNLFVLPKSLYLSKLLGKEKIDHIHAHWGTTTSTMAYIISSMEGIDFSFTVHRSDIPINNMLRQKVEKSRFCRVINEEGRMEVLDIIGPEYDKKVKKIFMGVDVPCDVNMKKDYDSTQDFVGLCPGRLTEKKGHRYLIEGMELLVRRGHKNIRIDIVGDGELRNELENMIGNLKLEKYVRLMGRKPHNELMDIYRERLVDFVVLPSIISKSGDKEGIPVALMEPMAYGIPVISTRTGGVEELLSNNSGILVEQQDAGGLASSIEELITSEEKLRELSVSGYRKVKKEFNSSVITDQLLKLFKSGREV